MLEWLPQATTAEQLRVQNRNISDIAAVIARLRHAETIDTFLDECTQIVQDFTGFDRVMIYRFLPDGSGEVVAEHSASPIPPKFIGLRFPAQRYPGPGARAVPDQPAARAGRRRGPPDTLVPPAPPDGAPLDQSHCMLRGLSPVHLSYLRNMGVRATLTMSIVIDGKLWGLIACHHHAPKVPPHQVREGLRQVCELTAEVANMRIETLSKLAAADQRLALTSMLSRLHQALLAADDIGPCCASSCPSSCRRSRPTPSACTSIRWRMSTGRAAGPIRRSTPSARCWPGSTSHRARPAC